jgi:hypothetical protein
LGTKCDLAGDFKRVPFFIAEKRRTGNCHAAACSGMTFAKGRHDNFLSPASLPLARLSGLSPLFPFLLYSNMFGIHFYSRLMIPVIGLSSPC